MKFEKFLKRCGVHSRIMNRRNGDKWLLCGGVGMKIPEGVIELLGHGKVDAATHEVVERIIKSENDDIVELTSAYIPADGRPNDIVRIFKSIGGPFDDVKEIGIRNADFGLLEKSDLRLRYFDLMNENDLFMSFLQVLDQNNEVVGFIQGIEEN